MTPAKHTGPFDLSGYCARLGIGVPPGATLQSLQTLQVRHPQVLAFENLDPFLGLPVALDRESLARKLIHGGRGGYCFEHNLLLADALRSLGFGVTALGARVLIGATPITEQLRTHMLLAVRVGAEPYIADVGFGRRILPAPLPLRDGAMLRAGPISLRLSAHGSEYLLAMRTLDGPWEALYCFGLEPLSPAELEAMNRFVATHPQSRFVTHLMAARAGADRQLALLDQQLTVRRGATVLQVRELCDAAALCRALESEFGLTLPSTIDVAAGLARLFAPPLA